jgi:hypothetical protein
MFNYLYNRIITSHIYVKKCSIEHILVLTKGVENLMKKKGKTNHYY